MANTAEFVYIRGNIEYSRLVTPIDGDELERDMSRRMQAGLQPIDRPYTTIKITNARILPRDSSGSYTAEEACIGQRMYQNPSSGPNGPWHFTCYNWIASLPVEFFMSSFNAQDRPKPIVPERELADGLDVILLLQVLISKKTQDVIVQLDSVIVQEPIRYREQP